VLGLLWLWSPFTEPAEETVDAKQAIVTEASMDSMEESLVPASLPDPSTRAPAHPAAAVIGRSEEDAGLGDYPGQTTPNTPAMAPPIQPPPGFWVQVDQTMQAGDPDISSGIRSWLESEGEAAGAIEDRARARLAELQSVETALVEVLVADAGLTQSQIKQLDRIFRLPADTAAKKLNQFIQARYDMRGEKVFKTLGAYIRTHRTPELTRVFMAMQNVRPRPGPLTRSWLANEMPVLLAGP
jgi:hypothetical protein